MSDWLHDLMRVTPSNTPLGELEQKYEEEHEVLVGEWEEEYEKVAEESAEDEEDRQRAEREQEHRARCREWMADPDGG